VSVEIIQQGGLTIAAFDPSWLRLYAPPYGPGQTVPTGPSDVLAATGAQAALNGPMFDGVPSDSNATYDVIDFLHYDPAGGISLPGRNPNEGVTIWTDGTVAYASPGGQVPSNAVVAIQTYPTLVQGGASMVDTSVPSNGTAEWRAAIAILADGRVALAVGAMTMGQLAAALIAAGATDAGYTDGSYSTALATPGGTTGPTPHRAVASWIIAVPPDGSSTTPTMTTMAIPLVLTAVAVGIFWATTHMSPGRHP
jgi:hypothetical protein